MGESKRRSQTADVEKRVLRALQEQAIGPVLPGVDCVQCLVIRMGHADEAQQALGGLPEKCADSLREAAAMLAGAGSSSGEGPVGVVWERWPSGRESVRLLGEWDAFRDKFLDLAYMNAGARGFGFQLCAFPAEGWASALQQVHDELAPHVQQIVELVQTAPTLRLETPFPGYTAVIIPKLEDDGRRAGVTAQLLRILDGMVSGREATLRNHGVLNLVFDGYDDDPREVWEFEQNIQLLRRVNAHAPWWLWLIAPETSFIWLGALVACGPTVVLRSNQVSFPLNRKAAELLLEHNMSETAGALLSAGADIDGKQVRQMLADSVMVVRQAIDTLDERQAELKAGKVAQVSDEEKLAFQRELQAKDEAESAARAAHVYYGIVLDRSERGRALLESLSTASFLAPQVTEQLRQWVQSDLPMAVLSGQGASTESWSVYSTGSQDTELHEAVQRVTAAAMAAKCSLAWSMGVDEPLVEKLSKLVQEGALEEGRKLGLILDASALETVSGLHKGLLDLATNPGGQEIDFNDVQLLDPEIFGQVMRFTLQGLSEVFAELHRDGTLDPSGGDTDVRAWRREDGSLLIRPVKAPYQEVVAPAGTWRQLKAGEFEVLRRQLLSRTPDKKFLQELTDVTNASLAEARRRKAAHGQLASQATSVVGLFGRGSRSLMALRHMIGKKEDATELADRWLESDEAYFLFWRARDGRAAVFIADDDEMLMSQVLPEVLEQGESPAATLLMAITDTPTDAKVLEWWKAHGGLLNEPVPPGH